MEHADLDSLIDRNIETDGRRRPVAASAEEAPPAAARPDRPPRRRARPARACLMADDSLGPHGSPLELRARSAATGRTGRRPTATHPVRRSCSWPRGGRAIDERSALVAEAGTGVGKTFAYLVPLLLSGGARWSAPPPRACRTSCSCVTCRACVSSWACRCAWPAQGPRQLPVPPPPAAGPETAQLPDRFAVRALARIEPGRRPPAVATWPRWTAWTSARP
jgi:hypothetical protein